jgi:acetyl-CoA C-acetyltransferase
MIGDGLWDAYADYHMGCTGEIVAEKYGVTRDEQDRYALASHQKAIAAQKAGRFTDEILPVAIPQKKGDPADVRGGRDARARTRRSRRSPG